jgi:hypothetical protein
MKERQRELWIAWIGKYPRTDCQMDSAEKLWAKKVTSEKIAAHVQAALDGLLRERAQMKDPPYVTGPRNWLADEIVRYRTGIKSVQPSLLESNPKEIHYEEYVPNRGNAQ